MFLHGSFAGESVGYIMARISQNTATEMTLGSIVDVIDVVFTIVFKYLKP